MLGVYLQDALCRVRRQRTVRVDTWQHPAAEVCYHVIDGPYLLLDGGRRTHRLGRPRSFIVNFPHNSATTVTQWCSE